MSDTLWDIILLLAGRSPFALFTAFLSILKGKAQLKARLAEEVDPAELTFLWNPAVISLLHENSSRERFLVTGADERIAREVCRRLSLFDGFIASDGKTNLTGVRKATRLASMFGEKGFDYVGNEWTDFPVWSQARVAYLANVSRGLATRVKRARAANVLNYRTRRLNALFRGLRPHQWVKNLIVFVPLLTAHLITDIAALTACLIVFAAFCMAASAFYLFNDLLDVHADRNHTAKRKRPIAAAELNPPTAIVAGGFLFACAFATTATINLWTSVVLAIYVTLNLAYTVKVKQLPILDVLSLGGLYTIRIIAGATATLTAVSSWLLAFSVFIFLSLGLVKRYTELSSTKLETGAYISRRGYRAEDLGFVAMMGISCAFSALLVFALYINSEMAEQIYKRPEFLWPIVPALFYGVSRIWLITLRGELHHDPVVFVVRDPASYVLAVYIGFFLWISRDPLQIFI